MAGNLRSVLYGFGSGIFLKGVQFLVSLLMIPFFLRDDMLGVTGYGQVATLLAVNGLLFVVTDGVRVSQLRSIAHSINTEFANGKIVGSCGLILMLIALPVSSVVYFFPEAISKVSGLPYSNDIYISIMIISTVALFDNINSICVSGLHSLGRTYIVNVVIFLEVITRCTVVYVIFSWHGADIVTFFETLLLFIIIKTLCFFCIMLTIHPQYFSGLMQARLSYALSTLVYSFSILANSLMPTILYKGSVIVVNKFVGSDAAAFLSILVVTLRHYVNQLTYGSLQPMMVPLSVRISPDLMSKKATEVISNSFKFYSTCVLSVIFMLSTCARELLLLWLGSKYAILFVSFQGVLLALAVEVSVAPVRSFLVAHGYAPKILLLTFPIGVACFSGIFSCLALGMNWEIVIVFTILFSFACYGLITDWIFSNYFSALSSNLTKLRWFSRSIAILILGCITFASNNINMQWGEPIIGIIIRLIIVMISIIVVCHFFILDTKSAVRFAINMIRKITT